jgi:hypothetical protein
MKNTIDMSCFGAPVNGTAYLYALSGWVVQTPAMSSIQGTSVPTAAGPARAIALAAGHTFRGRTAKQNRMGPPREAFQT